MICPFCEIEHTIAVPTVHLNGTSAEELLKQLATAFEAATTAIIGLYHAAPNNRDYYPTKQENQAQTEHTIRAKTLSAVRTELNEMRDHVQAVIDFKAAQKAAR